MSADLDTTPSQLIDSLARACAAYEERLAVMPLPLVYPPVHPRPSHVRVCVAALVVCDGRVLLLHRGPGAPSGAGWWSMPAGGIEPGDPSLVVAAARELREETGLDLVRGVVVHSVDGLSSSRPYVTMVVACEIAPGAEPVNREPLSHDDLQWFAPDAIPEQTWDRALLLRLLIGDVPCQNCAGSGFDRQTCERSCPECCGNGVQNVLMGEG